MAQPIVSFHSSGLYSGDYTKAYGNVGEVWRFQTQPIKWSKGRGGRIYDPVVRPTLRGADEQARKAIVTAWKAEEQTMRQLRWNYETGTATPVPGHKERIQNTYSQYANEINQHKVATNWVYLGLGLFTFYWFTSR